MTTSSTPGKTPPLGTLSAVLQARATRKVMVDPARPAPADPRHRDLIDLLLADAAFAPFHYPRSGWSADGTGEARPGGLDSPVPWRAHKLDAPTCRDLLARLRATDLAAGIVADMLAAADALVLVTWLPAGEAAEGEAFAGSLVNMEHVAAGGAMAQSLLLGATAAGYRTYWSSGGVLAKPPVTGWLGVPEDEVLLGAIFLFPAQMPGERVKPGKWRDMRGTIADWSRWCTLADAERE